MMGHLKLGSAFAAAMILAACATTDGVDDSMQVGVNDDDRFASNTDNSNIDELPDEMQFGIGDDDNFAATTTTPNTAVASRVIRRDQGIYTGTADFNNYTTVRGAITTADLGETLDMGEYTVFAPSNASFAGLDLSEVDKDDLATILQGHVIKGRIASADLVRLLDQNGGSYTAMTLSNEPVTFMKVGDKIKIADRNGYTYDIEAADNEFKNGYVHGINGVLGRTY